MPIYAKEAWIHYPERKPSPTSQTLLKSSFYGNEASVDRVNIGFTKFLARLRDDKIFVDQEEAVYFYNRQVLVQIFFRFPQGGPPTRKNTNPNKMGRKASYPLRRPSVANTHLQVDLFEITTPGSTVRADSLHRKRIGVIVVDISTRYIWCGPLQAAKSGGSVGRLVNKLISDNIAQHVTEIKTDAGTEFGPEFDAVTSPHFPHATHVRVNKAGLLTKAPGPVAPVETAVRQFREYLERYRRLQHSEFFTMEDFRRITTLANEEVHSAFGNKASPASLQRDPNKLQGFIEQKYTRDVAKVQQQTAGLTPLVIGDIVRLQRIRGAFTKQSYPNLTYDVYKVKAIEQQYIVHVKNERTSEEHRIHKNRIAKIKLPLEDPPETSSYKQFVARLRNLLDADKDYYLNPITPEAVPRDAEPERTPQASATASAAPAPPRRGGRERRPNVFYNT